jgi:hypothetical protein
MIRRIAMMFCLQSVLGASLAYAQPDPKDTNLRLWLKADDLVKAGLVDGSPVAQWKDASSYGTIVKARTEMNPSGPTLGADVDEKPHLRMVDINGKTVPTVRFDRNGSIFDSGDPNTDDSGSVDRLYQINNFDDPRTPDVNEDPTAIGDGTDLTAFLVFNPDFVDSLGPTGDSILGVEAVFGKRGDTFSLYEIGIEQRPGQPDFGKLITVNYDVNVKYASEGTPPEKTWQIVALTIKESDPTNEGISDLINFYLGTDGNPLEGIGGPLPMVDRNNAENLNDVVSGSPEPFGIGGHAQNCCGEGETFAGSIAEIILMSKLLEPDDREWKGIESYLNQKYFLKDAGLKGDFNANGLLDIDDINTLTVKSAAGTNEAFYDVTGDAMVNGMDVSTWAKDLKKTWIGDSNLDGQFNTTDLVGIFQAGKFESTGDANWSEGDWTGDGRFNTSDLVAAFQDGGFEQGVRPSVASVPEPTSAVLLLTSLLALGRVGRKR